MIDFCCPLCERNIYALTLRPSTRSTPWSDDCMCSDVGPCQLHQMFPNEMPARPDNQALEKRASAQFEQRRAEHEQRIRKLKERAQDYTRSMEGNQCKLDKHT